jgi:hypothetical protein
MKNLVRIMQWLVASALLCLGASVSFACTPPPPETIPQTWPQNARVLVTYDSNLNLVIGNAPAPMTTAVNNWNTATQLAVLPAQTRLPHSV